MAYHSVLCEVTPTLLSMLLSPLMVSLPSQAPGMEHCASGISQQALPRDNLSAIPRMCLRVAFSSDNWQIVSGSRDKTIKLWNTLGVCKYTVQDESHSGWVSCVCFSPNSSNSFIICCGWDELVKVWNLANCKLKTNHIGHMAIWSTETISLDRSFCASGGQDAQAMLWDLNEGKHLYTLDGRTSSMPCASAPTACYWLCAATGPNIKSWDLEGKIIADELKQEIISTSSKAESPQCTSLAWSADGQTVC